jgi:hypothetical protein
MKKLKQPFFWAALIVTIAACKKEMPSPAAEKMNRSTEQQVANLIQKGDPAMYDRIYGDQRTVAPSIHIHHGIFHWPSSSGPEDGYCIYNPNCVCMICIEDPHDVTDETEQDEITEDIAWSWLHTDEAELILNDSASTTIRETKSLDITHDESGRASVSWSVF